MKYLILVFGLIFFSCNNRIEKKKDKKESINENVENACKLIPDPGPCRAAIPKFYFDQKTQKCSTFIYGGCQGTVPFQTLEACLSECGN